MKTLDPKKDPGTPLCPFRKQTVFMAGNTDSYQTKIGSATFMEEHFLPCMKEKCMKYNQVLGCGM